MRSTDSYFWPNAVIAVRVLLAFVAAGLLTAGSAGSAVAAAALIVVVIAMDGLDGWVARAMNRTSKLGGILDITADRIVEHVFWIAFAVVGSVGLWVPLVVMTRSFLVDGARAVAMADGRSAFGDRTMMRSPVTRFLTGSRLMRSAYGWAKVVAFTVLALQVAASSASGWGEAAGALELLGGLSVVLAVTLCVVRGIPVLADARPYLKAVG